MSPGTLEQESVSHYANPLFSLGAKAEALADLNAERLNTETARLERAHLGKVLGIRSDVTSPDFHGPELT